MQTEAAGPSALPDGWPYEPADLKTWTEFNLIQERDYFTARFALGFGDDLDRQAADNVRAELEARAQCN